MRVNNLEHFHIKVDKKDSAYLYALFESYEGLCIYSTREKLENSVVLDVYVPFLNEEDFSQLCTSLENEMPIELKKVSSS